MKVAEFIKRYQSRPKPEDQDVFAWDHSLRSLARQHAVRPNSLHAGTAFDWEDLERYQQELERMDREGPGRGGSH